MPMFKDICRICMQGADYQELQEINIQKLNNLKNRPFLNFTLLSKWDMELFRNHLICGTCIQNFHAMKTVYRNAYKSNRAISIEKNRHQLSKVNLKRLRRFSHIEGDFIVCRLCLEPTRRIAIYLYDNSKNILPVEYIDKMLRYSKIYTNFTKTINPILCHLCWQNIQISYSFGKHLEMTAEKMLCYQTLNNKIYLDREDLQNSSAMWDQLGVTNITTEMGVNVKKEIKEENKLGLSYVKSTVRNLRRPTHLKKNITNIKEEYTFYRDHDYFKVGVDVEDLYKNKYVENAWSLKTRMETTKDCVDENGSKMPVLQSNVENENFDEMPKLKPNSDNKSFLKKQLGRKIHGMGEKRREEKLSLPNTNEQEREEVKPKSGKNKKALNVTTKEQELTNIVKDTNLKNIEIANIHNKQENEFNNTTYKEKLRSVKKYEQTWPKKTKDQVKTIAKKRKMKRCVQNKQAKRPKSPENSELLNVLAMDCVRPRTRQSTKKEIVEDLFAQDLLVLKREEIIKKKRQTRKLNISSPKHTSSPKLSKNTNKQSESIAIEHLSSKSNTNTEYTFEILTLDDDLQVKREVIEEEELQIKREVLSESESDDHFAENTECNANDAENFDDECPNLESFIKLEPPDDSFEMDLDEEGPPELEFQGPCLPVPIPTFTIQNTYTVDEKRHLINTVDEKRNLLNLIDEKAVSINTAVNPTRGSVDPAEDKRSSLVPSGVKRSFFNITPPCNLSKFSIDKESKRPLIKIKEDLYKIGALSVEKDCPRPNQMLNMVVNATKHSNNKTSSASQEKPKSGNGVSYIANIETQSQATKRNFFSPRDVKRLFEIYTDIDSREINARKPFSCSMCDFTAKSAKAAKSHIAQHSTNSLYFHNCSKCSFSSTRRKSVAGHMKKAHKNEKRNIPLTYCDYCKYGISSNKKSCVLCRRVFHTQCFIKAHAKSSSDCRGVTVEERGQQSTSTFCNGPTASKEVKQEMLNESRLH